MTRPAEKLLSEGIRLASYVDGQHYTTCPKCSHTRKPVNQTKNCLSVKLDGDDVVWNCHHCGWSGGGSSGDRRRVEKINYTRPEPFKLGPDPRPQPFIDWWAARAIGGTTLAEMDVRRETAWFPQTGKDQPCIAFPYTREGELINVKYRSHDKHFTQTKGAEAILYNEDQIADDELIWCEGEIDVLSFLEIGARSVTTLPGGAPASIPDPTRQDKRFEPLAASVGVLEPIQKIIIATDADEPGRILGAELARRLGKHRCWRINWPEGRKDANDVLVNDGPEALRALVDDAEPWPIDGVMNAKDLLPDILAYYRGEDGNPISTGFKSLDEFFQIDPGSLTVITGVPNHGKSNWVDQMAVQISQNEGWAFAIFSPEHKSHKHMARLIEKYIGKPFTEGATPRMSEAEVVDAVDWLKSRFHLMAAQEESPTIDWILSRARDLVLRYGVQGLIIDPYNEIEMNLESQSETQAISLMLSKLKRFAGNHGVSVFVVAHPRILQASDGDSDPVPSLYSIAGSAHWRNKADAGLVVHRDKQTNSTTIHVKKIRDQPRFGQLGEVKLFYHVEARRYSESPGVTFSMG